MDLGIRGRKAIVCAASKGLGKASALSLARDGVDLGHHRREPQKRWRRRQEEIADETGVSVAPVAGDIKTPEGRAAVLAACPSPDILINNAGGPPRGNFRDFTPEDWLEAVNGNMITAIELIKATVDGMIERKFGRIVNITSAAVRQPIPELCLSNAARAGLTGFVAGLSRETVEHNVTINNILPGPFRNRPPARSGCGKDARHGSRRLPQRRSDRPIRRSASASRTNSATPAPSCAGPRPASSPARTCCWTAATTKARCKSKNQSSAKSTEKAPALAGASSFTIAFRRWPAISCSSGRQAARLP